MKVSMMTREWPIQDLRPMSDVRCCYGNIHRCWYRCWCGVPLKALYHLAEWPVIVMSYQLIPISVTATNCY